MGKCTDCGKIGDFLRLCGNCGAERRLKEKKRIAEFTEAIEERKLTELKAIAKYQLAQQKARKTRVNFGTLIQQEMDAARKKLDSK